MKTYFPKSLAAIAISTLVGAASVSGMTTDPVGAVNKSLSAGLHVVTPEFVRAIDWQGAADSVSGSTITVSDTDLSSYTPGDYFVEIKSGPMVGLMATITSSTVDSVTVDESLASLNGDEIFCIRAHQKLEEILSGLDAGDPLDTIVVYFDDAGNEVQLGNTGTGNWQNILTGLNENPVILPGSGFVLFLQNSTELLTLGSVKTGPTLIPVDGDFAPNIIGLLNPVDDITVAASNISASMIPESDVLVLVNPDGSETQMIYSGTEFQNVLDGTNADSESIQSGNGVFGFFNTGAYIDIPVVYAD